MFEADISSTFLVSGRWRSKDFGAKSVLIYHFSPKSLLFCLRIRRKKTYLVYPQFEKVTKRYYCEVKGIEKELTSGLKIVFDFGNNPVYSAWGGLKSKQKLVDEKGEEIKKTWVAVLLLIPLSRLW